MNAPTMNAPTLDDLTPRQQAACYALAQKYRQRAEDIAPSLDVFFRLSRGEIGVPEAERVTGLVIFDQTHPTLF